MKRRDFIFTNIAVGIGTILGLPQIQRLTKELKDVVSGDEGTIRVVKLNWIEIERQLTGVLTDADGKIQPFTKYIPSNLYAVGEMEIINPDEQFIREIEEEICNNNSVKCTFEKPDGEIVSGDFILTSVSFGANSFNNDTYIRCQYRSIGQLQLSIG